MGSIIVQILLGASGLGGLITAIVAVRRSKVENAVDKDTSTLDQMKELNDRLDKDNLVLRVEVKDLRDEVRELRGLTSEIPSLRRQIAQLKQELEEYRRDDD